MTRAPSPKNAFRAILACALLGSAARAQGDDLASIRDFQSRFLSGKSTGTFRAEAVGRSALLESKKTALTREDWQRLVSAAPKNPGPELCFRLARHAFLLDMDPAVVNEWIDKIPRDPSAPWYASGRYLSGLLAIRTKDLTLAATRFSQASESAPKEGAIAKLSVLALARIAFAQKSLDRAEELYQGIVSRPTFDQTVLHELSWTHFSQGESDLAFTDLYLLFSLYPDSDELFQTAALLRRIYEKKSSLEEGAEALEKLALRFSVESESTDRAFRAFQGREDDLLFELDPTLGYRPARALVPTLAKKTLLRDSVVKERLDELRELDRLREELNDGVAFLEKCATLWKRVPEISIDSVTLLGWANALESKILGRPEPVESAEADRIRRWKQEVAARKDELAAVVDALLGADQYLSNQWMSIGGERAALTLLAKQDIRKQIAGARASQRRADRTLLDLDFALLERRFTDEIAAWEGLKANRPEALPQQIVDLDEIRSSALAFARRQSQENLGGSNAIRDTLRRQAARATVLAQRSTLASRDLLRGALPTIQSRIQADLNEYRWSIAESRYALFKAYRDKIKDTERQASAQSAKIHGPLDRIGGQLVAPRVPRESEDPDFSAFQSAALEYIRDARERIESALQEARDKDAPFQEHQQALHAQTEGKLRENAILAFQEYVRTGSDREKTPYALFRLAQLYIDQSRGQDGLDPSLAIAALERIRKDYPDYPYSDRVVYLLASALAKASRFAESDALLAQIPGRFPDSPVVADAQLRLGENRFNARDFPSARAHYAEVVKKGDEDLRAKARYKIAWCHYLERDYPKAIEAFGELLELSQSPDPKTRDAYVLFNEESAEYVAFSLYRLDEKQGASDMIGRIGNKPYTERIFSKTAEIFEDRGRIDQSAEMYDLLLARFPTSGKVPTYLEKRVLFAQKRPDPAVARSEKIRAADALAAGSAWRMAHQGDPAALANADALIERWRYDVATSLDASSDARGAMAAYQKVVDADPKGAKAYEATFRIAELAFRSKDYARATQAYDQILRNDRYTHHADEATYNLVACREAQLAERGDLRALAAKDPALARGLASDLLFAIDHFIERSPTHPDAAKAALRAAEIDRAVGRDDRAAERLDALIQRDPEAAWAESARLARVQIELDRQDWTKASALAARFLAEQKTLSPKAQSSLREIELSSDFMDAARIEKAGKPGEAMRAFLDFEKKHPDSPLASKAVFNAIVLARKSEDKSAEEEALSLLLTRYPESPEAKTAHLERARLLDATYDAPGAAKEYETALRDQGLSSDQKQAAYLSLAELYALREDDASAIDGLVRLSKEAREPAATQILLLASTQAEERGDSRRSERLLKEIANRAQDPWQRLMAHARLSTAAWRSRDARAGQRHLGLAEKEVRRLSPDQALLAKVEIANVLFAKSEHYRNEFDAVHLAAPNPETLSKGFQRKASLLNLQEKSAVESLSYPAPMVHVRALSSLDRSYRAFSREMLSVELPASVPNDERKKFRQTMKGMSDPLLAKADQASAKAKEIMASARISDPALSPVAETARNRPVWPTSYLPDLPPTMPYDREDAFPVTERAIEYLSKGNESLKNPWPKENREIAVRYFSRSLLEAPNYLPSLYGMALAQLLQPDRTEVARTLALVQKAAPPERWKPLAATYEYLQGRFVKAFDLAQETLKVKPDSDSALSLSALSLMAQKKFHAAVDAAKRFVRANPKDPSAHRLLAQAYAQSGDIRMAAFVLRRAYRNFPEDPRVQSAFAASLTDPQEKPLQGSILEKASAGGHPEAMARWFKLQFDAGNTAIAIDGMKSALDNGGFLHPEIVYDYKLFRETEGGKKP